jgi:hypothetical protein
MGFVNSATVRNAPAGLPNVGARLVVRGGLSVSGVPCAQLWVRG